MVEDESTAPFSFEEVASRVRHKASLLIYSRAGAHVIVVESGAGVSIGRGGDADITVSDRTLSRIHARFELVDDVVWVEDLDSTNGTFVNGTRIDRSPVRPGDEVSLGSVTASIHFARTGREAKPHSHDAFLEILETELARARLFRRNVALVIVRAAAKRAGMTKWCPAILSQLRHPVDKLGIYSDDIAEVLLPEVPLEGAFKFAQAVVDLAKDKTWRLVCGISLFPSICSSPQLLLETTLAAARRATRDKPIQLAGQRDETGMYRPVVEQDDSGLVVSNRAMIALFETVEVVARSTIPVLIFGETGTGKEVVACEIHRRSERRKRPMQTISCAAIPQPLVESVLFGHERGAFTGADKQAQGIFEAASGGTVFLDEIGELSPAAQATLLRVIESNRIRRVGAAKEIEVDVRLVAATNRDLEQLAARNEFRRDLFFRLNAMTLRIPPLRDRIDEIGLLAEHFVCDAARRHGFAAPKLVEEVRSCLEQYNWPGNVRELRNVIERAVVLSRGEPIFPDDLPERVRHQTSDLGLVQDSGADDTAVRTFDVPFTSRTDTPSGIGLPAVGTPRGTGEADRPAFWERVYRYEAELLLGALASTRGNKAGAARRLGIPLRTMLSKLQRHELAGKRIAELPPAWPSDPPIWKNLEGAYKERVQAFEDHLISNALRQCDGNKNAAARLLVIPLRTLLNKISENL